MKERDCAHNTKRKAQAQAAGYAAKEAILQEARQQREKVLNQAREEASVLEGTAGSGEPDTKAALAAAEVRTIAQEMASKVLGRNVGEFSSFWVAQAWASAAEASTMHHPS
jgi:hypothetical protein